MSEPSTEDEEKDWTDSPWVTVKLLDSGEQEILQVKKNVFFK